jgi:threonine aldolase
MKTGERPMSDPRTVDLRSDTLTLPTPEMLQAMTSAELGDDVYGEDPTVKRLEALAARALGKESALFVPSGTMANLVCLLSHCRRGDEAIMGHRSHMFLHEAGSSAVVGGVHSHTLPNQADGTLRLSDIEGAIRAPGDSHFPRSRLICLENTHNFCGGAVLSLDYMASVRALADRYSLLIHLDGARIFNAAIYLDQDPAVLAQYADSVSFCLSKGLSAPVGSLVCGSADLIAQAHRQRKMLGGGMRQVGVLAAAGIVALDTMVERLAQDHAHARQLAQGLAKLPGVELDPAGVQTNIVIFEMAPDTLSPSEFAAAVADRGVRVSAIGGQQVRAVTHRGIGSDDIERAIAAARHVLEGK